MQTGMTIGAAARRAGCSVATIRHYEAIGLLRAAKRSPAGRRVYGWPDIERLRLIRRLRALDFSLDDVATFLTAVNAGACLDARDLAQAHLAVVEARRAELEALERTLRAITASCTQACADGPSPSCTIWDDLRR